MSKEYVYTDVAIKAAYILNISHFVQFPQKDDLTELCIIGDDLIGVSIANQQSRTPELYGNLKILKRDANASLEACNILYISANQTDKLNSILYKTERSPILTISDIQAFTSKGGMIELAIVHNKVQMYINHDLAKERGIVLSAKLLNFAKRAE